MWTMQQVLFMGFDVRLAVFLSDEAAKSGGNVIKSTHEQIARNIGSAARLSHACSTALQKTEL